MDNQELPNMDERPPRARQVKYAIMTSRSDIARFLAMRLVGSGSARAENMGKLTVLEKEIINRLKGREC